MATGRLLRRAIRPRYCIVLSGNTVVPESPSCLHLKCFRVAARSLVFAQSEAHLYAVGRRLSRELSGVPVGHGRNISWG